MPDGAAEAELIDVAGPGILALKNFGGNRVLRCRRLSERVVFQLEKREGPEAACEAAAAPVAVQQVGEVEDIHRKLQRIALALFRFDVEVLQEAQVHRELKRLTGAVALGVLAAALT